MHEVFHWIQAYCCGVSRSAARLYTSLRFPCAFVGDFEFTWACGPPIDMKIGGLAVVLGWRGYYHHLACFCRRAVPQSASRKQMSVIDVSTVLVFALILWTPIRGFCNKMSNDL